MFKDDLLAGRVIVVTGGGSGLGKAMARRAAELGARVGIIGRRLEKLEEAAAELRETGAQVAFRSVDVRDAKAVHDGFNALEDELGPLDSLINNAAGNFLSASEELSPNGFKTVVDIVLHGTFNCTMDFGRRVIADEQRRGSILNITTTYAWMGSAFVLPSACAKAGVMVMTRSLAVEWADYGIRVNAIAPGPIPTKGAFSRLMVGGMEEMAKKRIPLGRFGEPEEIGNLACYLLADEAGYITGETVTLDGGEWLRSGQEFSSLLDFDRDELREMLRLMKARR
jgi:NAD(P)-dependent dehydrogenase (short-subunit alcohol dehydrogenase family)